MDEGYSMGVCTVSTFHPMEDVPTPHREKWARAVSLVFTRVMLAEREKEITRALEVSKVAASR